MICIHGMTLGQPVNTIFSYKFLEKEHLLIFQTSYLLPFTLNFEVTE